MKIQIDVPAEVRAAAARQRVTQSDIARQLGVSRMSIYRRMSGETPFTVEDLVTLAEFLHVPVATFFAPQTAPADSQPVLEPALTVSQPPADGQGLSSSLVTVPDPGDQGSTSAV